MLSASLKKFVALNYKIFINKVLPIDNGLINHSYLIYDSFDYQYIIQEINSTVFDNIYFIQDNLEQVNLFLQNKKLDYFYPKLVYTINGKSFICFKNKFYRILHFIPNSQTYNQCSSIDLAAEASRLLGKFYLDMTNFELKNLKPTILNFHNLNYYIHQFINSFNLAPKAKLIKARPLITIILQFYNISSTFNKIVKENLIKLRVTHRDTKIGNFIFFKNKAIGLIDFDTIYQGYFISDLGDMFRTYLPNVDENYAKIQELEIDWAKYEAIVTGFKEVFGKKLSREELNFIPYSGYFMIFMQAIRFLTDFLSANKYYKINYPEQNYDRCQNQLKLLKEFDKKFKNSQQYY